MEIAATKRIDAGIPRGPRKPVRKMVDRSPKSGQFITAYPDGLRDKVVAECQTLIAVGWTPAQIAEKHGIPARTVQYWLLGDEKAEAARGQLIAAELARTLDDMRKPDDGEEDSPLRLARAREEFRAWSWIAERRESRLYGQKQELTITDKTDLGDRLRRSMERVIEGESTVIAAPHQVTQVIESTSDAPHNTGELPE